MADDLAAAAAAAVAAVKPPLPQSAGWAVIIGFGIFFTIFTMLFTQYEERVLGNKMSSEHFNTAGRNVGIGLTAAVIVSQWTWAATLLMSSNMGWRVGVAGPFWYASGATIQILLFAILAIQVKRRASHMHTFMEIIRARFGLYPHCIMIFFALLANMIVTSMLVLGGAGTISDLTGVPKLWASFLMPLLACWFYTMYGGLRATFFASYVHTTVIFVMLLLFTFSVYAGAGDESDLFGSPGKVYDALQLASRKGYFNAVRPECEWTGTCTAAELANMPSQYEFSGIWFIMENAGLCHSADQKPLETACVYKKLGKEAACCADADLSKLPSDGKYCRKDNSNCIDTGAESHYESTECGPGETCVTSFLTMKSASGLLFGITNIVGNFGTVFVDQSYWQSAVAAKPKSAVFGFLVGGMVWFAVPFCMATTNGLAGRAITTHPKLTSMYITAKLSGDGLCPARVLAHIMGPAGASVLLLQLFMAITSTGSAEIIAVSSILTYDIYYTYINPELKYQREKLRKIFFKVIGGAKTYEVAKVQELLHLLAAHKFFDGADNTPPAEFQPLLTDEEIIKFCAAINGGQKDNGTIDSKDLYDAMNRCVSKHSIEGPILLRVSKMFTFIFALVMGFLAAMLDVLKYNLGFVYMAMGVLIGSAVGPASLAILFEKANGKFVAAGAVGGFCLGIIGWTQQAKNEFGAVTYDFLNKDMPFVVGNVVAIMSGLTISLLGSIVVPDTEFRWEYLNERIPLVDDVEPPKDAQETDERLNRQVYIAYGSSIGLTLILVVLWPLPMHFGGAVFPKGQFTVWVAVEMIWAIIGSIVIIFLPLYETVMDIKAAKAVRQTATSRTICGKELNVNYSKQHIQSLKAGKQASNEEDKPKEMVEC
jgi:Na+/proline symporter